MEEIRQITKEMEEYPQRLRVLPHMPGTLRYYGRLPDDRRPSLAIVGARECSDYGKQMAYTLANMYARMGIQIISGMARGVDASAHSGAIEGGGESFAVLGCGVDVCYPASSRKLYERMKVSGGVLSEFPEGMPPLAAHFPKRNRLISGLADAVLVIEAKESSGSLITADIALEQGKTVFALPGRLGDLLSAGTNRLIYQGAVPLWKPQTLPEEMGWGASLSSIIDPSRTDAEENTVLAAKKLGLSDDEILVYRILEAVPKTLPALQEETGLSAGRLLAALLRLENHGCVREVWKQQYVRIFSPSLTDFS